MRRLARKPIPLAGREVFGFAWNGCSASTVTVFGLRRYGVRLRPEWCSTSAGIRITEAWRDTRATEGTDGADSPREANADLSRCPVKPAGGPVAVAPRRNRPMCGDYTTGAGAQSRSELLGVPVTCLRRDKWQTAAESPVAPTRCRPDLSLVPSSTLTGGGLRWAEHHKDAIADPYALDGLAIGRAIRLATPMLA